MSRAPETLLPFEGPAAWYGSEMAKRSEAWRHDLTSREVEEISAAVALVMSRGTPIVDITRADFALPNLGTVLDDIQEEVINGRGFAAIRGVPVADYTIEEAAIAYVGIGTYLGWAIPQNTRGHVLGHVKDIGLDPNNPEHRISITPTRPTSSGCCASRGRNRGDRAGSRARSPFTTRCSRSGQISSP